MQVTSPNYHRLAKSVGLLLTLMGMSLIAVFVVFVATGENVIADGAPGLDGVGLLILASIGAFALPLGASLFSGDRATSARLRIAAYALGVMAVLRLVAFANPDIRAALGFTPLGEFFVLGAIAFVAFAVRPEDEAAVEMHMQMELDAPASKAWRVLAEQFGAIGEWAVAIETSSLDGEPEVGAVRTCEVAGFGPVAPGKITEELIVFDPAALKFTYIARSGLPRMIRMAKNRWSIEALGSERCRVRSHASMDLPWWALPFAVMIHWSMRAGVSDFTEELRHRVESGTAHPRKVAALAS